MVITACFLHPTAEIADARTGIIRPFLTENVARNFLVIIIINRHLSRFFGGGERAKKRPCLRAP